jgi:hypothetical protein
MEINRNKRRSYWAIGLLNRDSIGPAEPFLGTSVNKQDRSTLGRVVSSDAVHKSEREKPAGYYVLVSLWLQRITLTPAFAAQMRCCPRRSTYRLHVVQLLSNRCCEFNRRCMSNPGYPHTPGPILDSGCAPSRWYASSACDRCMMCST